VIRPAYRSKVALIIAVFAACAGTASSQTLSDLQELRDFDFLDNNEFHGYIMDDQHKLLVKHENNVATIQLHKKTRPAGGPFEYYDLDTGEDTSIIRYEEIEELYRIRAEVLVPAPPNYLKNPGMRYRIMMEGITVAPDYTKVFEANAGDALAAIFNEIDLIYNDTHGIYRPAVYYGAIIALRILNQAGLLPAELPNTY